MNAGRVTYHLARADFYERVRSYSFLILLGLSVFLGYQVANGNLTLTLGHYRGEFNSAWVGAMMAINATFFLGWFGFYLVKGSVERDRRTGVGQIMATTPLTRPLYMLGKWLSNLAVLLAMAAVLALAGLVIQVWKGENTQIDLVAFLAPFLFLVLPLLALVAAMAVLFEAIPFLQGGFGNVVYFVGFIALFPIFLDNPGAVFYNLEPMGFAVLERSMGDAVRAIYSDYNGGFSLGPSEFVTDIFTWKGVDWTPDILLARFTLLGVALLLVFLAALLFDRFDPARYRLPNLRRVKVGTGVPVAGAASAGEVALDAVSGAAVGAVLPARHLSPLAATARRYDFFAFLKAEVNLLLKGQRWWWYVVAGGLLVACLTTPLADMRAIVLPLAWAWPVLVWSSLGSREAQHDVQQIVFSAASPLWRQLPAQWLAGFGVALLMGSVALLRMALAGDMVGLLAALSGAFFIPSLALAAGVWSRSSKLFEVLYVTLVYLGPLNRIPALDFTGAAGAGRPEFFIPFSLGLLALAFFGRARQIRK